MAVVIYTMLRRTSYSLKHTIPWFGLKGPARQIPNIAGMGASQHTANHRSLQKLGHVSKAKWAL